MDELKIVYDELKKISDDAVVTGADLKDIIDRVFDYCEFEVGVNKRRFETAIRLMNYRHASELKAIRTGQDGTGGKDGEISQEAG